MRKANITDSRIGRNLYVKFPFRYKIRKYSNLKILDKKIQSYVDKLIADKTGNESNKYSAQE